MYSDVEQNEVDEIPPKLWSFWYYQPDDQNDVDHRSDQCKQSLLLHHKEGESREGKRVEKETQKILSKTIRCVTVKAASVYVDELTCFRMSTRRSTKRYCVTYNTGMPKRRRTETHCIARVAFLASHERR